MASLPRKAHIGEDFKSYTTSAINRIIDYLHAMRLRPGNGISIRESPSGVTIELEKQPGDTPQAIGNVGSYGIEATVVGSTALISLVSGGTSNSFSMVPSGDTSFSAGANGELIVNTTGSGVSLFPNYTTIATSYNFTTGVGYSGNRNCWLMGYIYIGYDMFTSSYPVATINAYLGGGAYTHQTLISANIGHTEGGAEIYFPVCVPMPANQIFYFDVLVGSSSLVTFDHIALYSIDASPVTVSTHTIS